MDDDKPSGHKSNGYGYYGNRRFVGKDKSKKSMAPKDITLSKSNFRSCANKSSRQEDHP